MAGVGLNTRKEAHLYIHKRLLDLGFFDQQIEEIFMKYAESHRFYHNIDHIIDILKQIEKDGDLDNDELFLTAIFHDIIYDPQSQDNEKESVKYFEKIWGIYHRDDFKVMERIKTMILDTEHHKPTTELSRQFINYDLDILYRTYQELLQYEKAIFKEFQFVPLTTYKVQRVGVLKALIQKHKIHNKELQYLIEYVQNFQPKIGLYPGSFNPFHKGHLNILEKAEQIFDKVIVLQGSNPSKNPSDGHHDLPVYLRFRQTDRFNGLLTDYIDHLDYDVSVVRGLRNGSDLQYELNQYRFLQDLKPDIKVVSIFCDREFEHISSSAIRQMKKISYMRPELVKKYL